MDSTERASGVELIAAERRRQVAEEGWTAEHDSVEHPTGELNVAACCYGWIAHIQLRPDSLSRAAQVLQHVDERVSPYGWPWSREWWKPSTDPVRNLVKAGALIAAEIDRLQRAALRGEREG